MKLHREKALREILASEDLIETAVHGRTAHELAELERKEALEARRQAEMDAAGRWMNSRQRRNLRKTLERQTQED
jgi:hypothetical protein